MNKNKIEAMINKIKSYNLITDLKVSYNIDNKSFIVFDKIENKLIKGLTFDLTEFHYFIDKLSELSLWNSDYEMEFKIIKN